jgi:DNA (cytosine-5)-methyltransferase 1
MNELHLFAGAGGGILGGMLLGHTPVCAVEIEPYCRKVLLQRQRDGILPKFPIWDDVCTFDGKPWRGLVDVVCGGFPCQDISAAGRGAGIEGERSGLWKEMARIIGEIRPRYVFIENSPLLRTRGLSVVLKDLAEMGYDARWGVLGAHHVGAPHKRQRVWIVAYSATSGLQGDKSRFSLSTTRRAVQPLEHGAEGVFDDIPKPYGLRSYHGVANAVDRIKAIGNGQVPAVARLAWNVLTKNI